ncbi:MAG: DUF134 domain-containing protein [Oliverpabstia sp.]
MARPIRCRRICAEPVYDSFIPKGRFTKDNIILTVDEYEVIRLIDLEKFTHEQCAKQMDISRTTVTEVYKSAREKLADSIVNGKSLLISGGHYRVCDNSDVCYCRKDCNKTFIAEKIQEKGENQMRIAVTYENGMIFQHFGHTEKFKLYDVENDKIVHTQIVDTNGQGHGALSVFLTNFKTDILICGGIGGGAQTALSEAGIKLYGGVSGSADEAVNAYLNGGLNFNPDVHCEHHEHHDGGHSCGEDKHGCDRNGGHCNG